ncbi:MAG: hypothetical protein H6591_07355 [Flavobacteriales bacterium]|nr:hypothetical protein [Flavobacteriales bacterium]
MSRAALVLIFLGWHGLACAQPGASQRDRDLLHRHDAVLRVEGSFDYNANSLLNEVPLELWRGAYLDRDLRGRSRDAMRGRNSLGYTADARLTYIGREQGRWRSLLSLAHHEHFGARFTADLYNLTFFGNAAYENRRADLGPAAFTRIRYQTIGFGFQDTRSTGYARLDFVIGQSLNQADIRWADLYTGTDGRLLRSKIRGEYLVSDTASNRLGTLNGFGLAFSGRWSIPFRRNTGLRIELEAQDLGFSAWGPNNLRLDRDTTIAFQGITVDNIFDLDQLIIGEDALLDTFGLRYRTASYATLLPFVLSAAVRASLSPEWDFAFRVDQRNLPGYLPQLQVSAQRRYRSTDIGASLSMGGFGGLRLGARLTRSFGERVLLTMDTPHLPGLVTARTRGAGFGFAISYGIGQRKHDDT